MSTKVLERVVVTFETDGSFKGAHVTEHYGVLTEEGIKISKVVTSPLGNVQEVRDTLPEHADLLAQLQAATDTITMLEEELYLLRN